MHPLRLRRINKWLFTFLVFIQVFNPVEPEPLLDAVLDNVPIVNTLRKNNSQSNSNSPWSMDKWKDANPLTKLKDLDILGLVSTTAKSSTYQNRYGDQDEISGLLGASADESSSVTTTPPIVQLKRGKPESGGSEPPCERSYYMGPFSETKWIHANASVQLRSDTNCTWNIFGTEACIPMIECPHFKLDPRDSKTNKCSEYLGLYDGHMGLQKFCGEQGPVNVTAASGLRDLYIRFHSSKHQGTHDPKLGDMLKFNCSISCANRKQGNPLLLNFSPYVNNYCTCGVKGDQNRIIGGEDAQSGEFPWLASLVQKNTRQVFCGGALINDRMVLTAAHCIKGLFLNVDNLEVLLNAYQTDPLPNMHVLTKRPVARMYNKTMLKILDAADKSFRHQLEEIMVHPLYVAETNQYDVALLKLATPIALGKSVSTPVCLPTPGSFMRTYAMRNATIAGWGLTNPEANQTTSRLQKLTVNVFPPSKCKKFYAHRVTRRSICAGYERGGKDSCMGDSGGPLITQDKPDVWFQIATVSWGEGCADPENPGVYFRTTESGPWVHYQSNKHDAVWCEVPT